jgi:hypothetical protein
MDLPFIHAMTRIFMYVVVIFVFGDLKYVGYFFLCPEITFLTLHGLLYIVVPSKYTRLKMTVFLLTDNIIIK